MVYMKSDLKISNLDLEEQFQLKYKKAGTARVNKNDNQGISITTSRFILFVMK